MGSHERAFFQLHPDLPHFLASLSWLLSCGTVWRYAPPLSRTQKWGSLSSRFSKRRCNEGERIEKRRQQLPLDDTLEMYNERPHESTAIDFKNSTYRFTASSQTLLPPGEKNNRKLKAKLRQQCRNVFLQSFQGTVSLDLSLLFPAQLYLDIGFNKRSTILEKKETKHESINWQKETYRIPGK